MLDANGYLRCISARGLYRSHAAALCICSMSSPVFPRLLPSFRLATSLGSDATYPHPQVHPCTDGCQSGASMPGSLRVLLQSPARFLQLFRIPIDHGCSLKRKSVRMHARAGDWISDQTTSPRRMPAFTTSRSGFLRTCTPWNNKSISQHNALGLCGKSAVHTNSVVSAVVTV